MKNSKRFPQRLAVVCVGLALAISLITLVPNASAAGSQTWWFRDIDRSPAVSGMDYTKQIVRGVSTAPSNYETVIITTKGLCLVANEAASTNVGFTGTWTGKICYTGDGAVRTITLTLGYVTDTTFTSSGATQSFSTAGDGNDYSVDISITPSGTFTIPSGSYLALKITISSSSQSLWAEGSDATGTGPKRAESYCASSRLISPSSDPGYPVPELSTLILMSAGLVAGTAILVYGNKKTK